MTDGKTDSAKPTDSPKPEAVGQAEAPAARIVDVDSCRARDHHACPEVIEIKGDDVHRLTATPGTIIVHDGNGLGTDEGTMTPILAICSMDGKPVAAENHAGTIFARSGDMTVCNLRARVNNVAKPEAPVVDGSSRVMLRSLMPRGVKVRVVRTA